MVRINLLPVRVSKKKEAGKQQLVLFALALIIGIGANVFYAQGRVAELKKKEKAVADATEQVKRLDKIIGEVTSLKQEQQQLEEKLKILDALKQGRIGPVRMLDELARVTPRKLWLTSIEEKGSKLSIQGMAVSNFEVSQFMEELQRSQYFAAVELKRTSSKVQGDVKVVEFTLGADAKYAPAPPAPAAAAGKGAPAKKGT